MIRPRNAPATFTPLSMRTVIVLATVFATACQLRADDGIEWVVDVQQPEIQQMLPLYKSRMVDYQKDEMHLRIAEKLYQLHEYPVVVNFLKNSSICDRVNLSTLRQCLILAEALHAMDEAGNFAQSETLLRSILAVSPDKIVELEWEGDRMKSLLAPSAREMLFPITPEMKDYIVKQTIENSRPGILRDLRFLQLTAANRLGKYAFQYKGTEALIQLSKEYSQHPNAAPMLDEQLKRATSQRSSPGQTHEP